MIPGSLPRLPSVHRRGCSRAAWVSQIVWGLIWSNGALVTVVPGITPNPSAPPVFFGVVTAAALLALGGGNLPLTNPGAGSLQLWNNGGVVAVA